MRTPDYIIKIAADSVAKLRRVDVYRVIDNCSDEERKPTARYIVVNRPELSAEVSICLVEVGDTAANHQTDNDCVVGPDGLCIVCLVDHSGGCDECGTHGFHTEACSLNEANWV